MSHFAEQLLSRPNRLSVGQASELGDPMLKRNKAGGTSDLFHGA